MGLMDDLVEHVIHHGRLHGAALSSTPLTPARRAEAAALWLDGGAARWRSPLWEIFGEIARHAVECTRAAAMRDRDGR